MLCFALFCWTLVQAGSGDEVENRSGKFISGTLKVAVGVLKRLARGGTLLEKNAFV